MTQSAENNHMKNTTFILVVVALFLLVFILSSNTVHASGESCSNDKKYLVTSSQKTFCGVGRECSIKNGQPDCYPCNTNGGKIVVIILAGNDNREHVTDLLQKGANMIKESFSVNVNNNVNKEINIFLIPGRDGPKNSVKDTLSKIEDVLKNTNENDIMLFFYYGHGGELVMSVDNYNHKSIDVYQLEKVLNMAKAKTKIFIADSCYSGSFVEYFQKKDTKNIVVISSSLADTMKCLITDTFAKVFADRVILVMNGGAESNKVRNIVDYVNRVVRVQAGMLDIRVGPKEQHVVNYGLIYPRNAEIPNFCQ